MTRQGEKGTGNRTHRLWLGALCLLPSALCLLPILSAQQIYREGFEGRETVWIKGASDAEFKETAHRLTEDTAHGGQRSEQIQLEAAQGTYIHYYHDIGRAPIIDEQSISLWLKANRPGVQLLARLVLPNARNPKNPAEPLTALVLGDQYQLAGRWQRLELRRPVKLLQDQQQLLRVELNRDVDVSGAYVDRLVLNLYGGPGPAEVWIDDLEVGPLLDAAPFKSVSQPAARDGAAPRRAAVVSINRDNLLVSGKRFFFRATRHTDAPLKVLRDAGFNTVWFDESTPPAVLDEAVNLGFWIVPSLSSMKDRQLTAAESLGRSVAQFLERDEVLFWDLGGGLAADPEQVAALERTAQLVRSADPRPLAADVWDGFQPYSRSVNLLGVHRWPLMTGLELARYREWLNQRRLLAQPGTFFWTWVQTHLPDWYTSLVSEEAPAAGSRDQLTSIANRKPTGENDLSLSGPQPEQIRLLTYTALAAGCRGLGFWSDRFVAERQGRDRLLALALLNQELQMLEPLLVTAEAPAWIETSQGDIKAAVMRTDHGILVLPMWMGAGSQCVAGQGAAAKLTIKVPMVPPAAQAWEVSPGEVRSLESKRVAGGTEVTLPEFGLTTAIVFTTDIGGSTGLIPDFQKQERRLRKLAAQWSYDLAALELEKVTRVNGELEQAGRRLPDGAALLDNARGRLQTSSRHFDHGNYREAYREAQRTLRPLRILMRAQWEQATRDLDAPVSSPYAVNFFTLPRHWQLAEQVRQASLGANQLPGGDFEAPPDETPYAWLAQPVTLDDVEFTARRVAVEPHGGSQCLMLQVRPKNPQLPPAALERTFLAIHSPAVRLEPGSLVRVSGWVRIPGGIAASADGALLYDSAGGEPLAVRLTGSTPWKKFALYRRVPASGTISMTVALTGLGTVYFDDLQIEPLLPAAGPRTAAGPPIETLRSPAEAPERRTQKKPDQQPPKKTPATPTGRRPGQ